MSTALDQWCQKVSDWYDSEPSVSTGLPWLAYAEATGELYANVTNVIGVGNFIPSADDPYRTSEAMFADWDEHGKVCIFTGGQPHPLWDSRANYLFRCEHDWFHLKHRLGFARRSELLVGLYQSRQHSELVKRVIWTKTLAQTCWFHHSPVNLGKPLRERCYPAQKALLFPVEWARELATILNVTLPIVR